MTLDAVEQAAAQHGGNGSSVLWFATVRRQHQISDDLLTVGLDLVTPVRSVRDLRIYLDSDLSMRTDCVQLFCSSTTDRSISRSVSRSTGPAVTYRVAGVVTSGLW